MIKYEDYSRSELKTIAKQRGLSDYHNLSKPDLIKLIVPTDVTSLENSEIAQEFLKKHEESKTYKKQSLSLKAIQWQNYLAKIKITPESFIQRFPDIVEKEYIYELISFKNDTEEI